MSFPKQLNTDNQSIELVSPDIERDTEIAMGWLEGEPGKQTLLLMGVPEAKIHEPTTEEEQSRIADFIELDTQFNWMIQLDGKIIGSVWVDLEDSDHVKAPAIHIMIGDKAARGKGAGKASMKAVMDFLVNESEYEKIYSRHLTENMPASNLLSDLGFVVDGSPYLDEDGLQWQNVTT